MTIQAELVVVILVWKDMADYFACQNYIYLFYMTVQLEQVDVI